MITRQDIEEISDKLETPVLSVYLYVDDSHPLNQATTPEWRVWIENALSQLAEDIDEAHHERWEIVVRTLHDYLEDYEADTKTLALFMTPEKTIVHRLPDKVDNAAYFGELLTVPAIG